MFLFLRQNYLQSGFLYAHSEYILTFFIAYLFIVLIASNLLFSFFTNYIRNIFLLNEFNIDIDKD